MEESLLQILLTLLLVKLNFCFSLSILSHPFDYFYTRNYKLCKYRRGKNLSLNQWSVDSPITRHRVNLAAKVALVGLGVYATRYFLTYYFFLRGKRPERISKRSNDEEFYVKVKFFPLA